MLYVLELSENRTRHHYLYIILLYFGMKLNQELFYSMHQYKIILFQTWIPSAQELSEILHRLHYKAYKVLEYL